MATRSRRLRRPVPSEAWHKRAYQHRLCARKAAPTPVRHPLARLVRARETLLKHHFTPTVSNRLSRAISTLGGGGKTYHCKFIWVCRIYADAQAAKLRGSCSDRCKGAKDGGKGAAAPKPKPTARPSHKQPLAAPQPAAVSTSTADPKAPQPSDGVGAPARMAKSRAQRLMVRPQQPKLQ